jgi:hypothetical protein
MSDLASLELTPVERLLLACCRAAPDPAAMRQALHAAGLDWAAFWELARRQEVQPLVARALARSGLLGDLPAPASSDVEAARIETTARNLAARAELEAIAAALGARGVPVMPLKGVALALRIFGGLDARRCGDIDILVREEDWEVARRALQERGYRPLDTTRPRIREHPFHDVPLIRSAGGRGFVVELHHQLTDRRFARIDHAALWRRALATGSAGLVEMPAEDLLVFLALHLPKHDAGMLRLIADIDHLIAGGRVSLDWDRVLELAGQWRARTPLYFALAASTALLETPVPEQVRAALRPRAWKRRAITALAGPLAMLRPPAPARQRADRFRLAYCLMLEPASLAVRAYRHYVLAPTAGEAGGFMARRGGELRGAARTLLALAHANGDAATQPHRNSHSLHN